MEPADQQTARLPSQLSLPATSNCVCRSSSWLFCDLSLSGALRAKKKANFEVHKATKKDRVLAQVWWLRSLTRAHSQDDGKTEDQRVILLIANFSFVHGDEKGTTMGPVWEDGGQMLAGQSANACRESW